MIVLDILVRSIPLVFIFLIIRFYNPITKEKQKRISNVIAVIIILVSIIVSYTDTISIEAKIVYLIVSVIGYILLIRYQIKNSYFK